MGTGAAPAAGVRGLSRQDAARAAELRLGAAVHSLAGCLGNLPDRLRLVLQLRAGIGIPRALSAAAVAKRLHLGVRQVLRLQRQGLRRLRTSARTRGCARATAAGARSAALVLDAGSAAGKHGGASIAAGGVEAARYAKPATPGPAGENASPGGASALGISRPSAAGNTLLVLAIVLTGALLVAIAFAEELGLGTRYRQWRAQWGRRPPR
jgi:hypothetical protein